MVQQPASALGPAMIFSNSPAILTHAFPPAQRGRVLGIQSTTVYLGLASGPPLGGWLADTLGWRAAFFLNVPVGLIALLLSLRFIPRDEPSGRSERLYFPHAVMGFHRSSDSFSG